MRFGFNVAKSMSPAYGAALALIAIQVGIGLLYKAAQSGGNYGFSATSSVTISEFLKFLLSCSLFFREIISRSQRLSSADNGLLENGKDGHIPRPYLAHRYDVVGFCNAYAHELPTEVSFGFAHLSLFYVLINNTIFLLFQLADPGTIQLIKSSNILMTAGASTLFLGTSISPKQWIILVLLVCGIIVTQYNPRTGTTYSLSTYLLLFFQTFLSATSSIYNQKLCKSSDGSLHAMNMTLYLYGALSNLVLHIMVRVQAPNEPGFFTGYRHPGAVLVVLSNVFIGLAMTAVYKYADALIKCFATALSTAILLYLSPLLFDISVTALVVPGTLVIFLATFLYMECTPKKPTSTAFEIKPMENKGNTFFSRLLSSLYPSGPFRFFGLILTTLLTFLIVGFVTALKAHWITNGTIANNSRQELLESPFKNTLAFIRSNHALSDRIPTLVGGYSPFFRAVHISMPEEGYNDAILNLTRDYWSDGFTPYQPVQALLTHLDQQGVLEKYDGVLYWHFDAWIEPLSFHDMDKTRIWLTNNGDELKYMCMGPQPTRHPDWMWWGGGAGVADTLKANKVTYNMLKDFMGHGFDMDPDEYCMNWSDIYYIPRRFFRDFILLAKSYGSFPIFHEIAVPTMFRILDRTHSPHPSASVIQFLGDCWGGCCSANPTKEDILDNRCGHKMEYRAWHVTEAHFTRLEENAKMLGKPRPWRTAAEPVDVKTSSSKGKRSLDPEIDLLEWFR